MKSIGLVFALLAFPISAAASYKSSVLEPWIGATKDELVSKWGYPQSANDVVRIDEETTVYSYRSFRGGFGGPMQCVVSFTLHEGVVTHWKYEGGNCPRNKRYSKQKREN